MKHIKHDNEQYGATPKQNNQKQYQQQIKDNNKFTEHKTQQKEIEKQQQRTY